MDKKQWLIAVILTFITVCFWVGFEILHKRHETKITPQVQELIEPIDPNFDLTAIEKR